MQALEYVNDLVSQSFVQVLCPCGDPLEAGIKDEADPEVKLCIHDCLKIALFFFFFSSRPQTLLYSIVVAVMFPVDCSEENFGLRSQTSRLIFSLTPVRCGRDEFCAP